MDPWLLQVCPDGPSDLGTLINPPQNELHNSSTSSITARRIPASPDDDRDLFFEDNFHPLDNSKRDSSSISSTKSPIRIEDYAHPGEEDLSIPGQEKLPFAKLPDSQEYLASLENKLQSIRKGGKKGPQASSLLASLSQTRESCMLKLLSKSPSDLDEDRALEEYLADEVKVNLILKKLAPEKQAISQEELVHLVKADLLDLSLNPVEETDTVTSAVQQLKSAQKMEYWNQKTFCLITGASRGIGRTIAIEFSKKVAPSSLFVLVARTTSALESTKEAIISVTQGKVAVVTATLDLEKPERSAYFALVADALSKNNTKASDFDHSILVHNAGSLGATDRKVVEWEDLPELQSYFTLNVFSMILLNSQFFKIFNDAGKQRSVVQITSLSAIQPFKTWGFYCAGKSVRDMLMKSLALESGIQVLSWAPGPVETEMYDQACKATADPDLNKVFNESRENGQVLSCEQTITKLVKVLGEKKYVNGEHADYFDE